MEKGAELPSRISHGTREKPEVLMKLRGGFGRRTRILMKKLIQLPLLIAAVLLLGACSTVNSRINEKAPLFYSLDPNTRAKIAHGDIDIGFTPDMVYIALGRPDVTRQQVSNNGQTEQWIYRSYYYDDWPGYGYVGYHRWYAWNPYGRYYRVYWEPMFPDFYTRGIPEDDIRVTFQNGKVVMIDQART